MRKEVDRLLRTIRELSEATEPSSKTKVEIKNLVKKLKRQANDVNKEWRVIDERTPVIRPTMGSKETSSIAVQTNAENIKKELDNKRWRTVE